MRIDAPGPFGDPDGSRADLKDLFVSFGGVDRWGGLATREDDLTARVLVGRKGSGKTLYLRRLQEHLSLQDDLFSDAISQSPPTTEMVITFCNYFEESHLTEKWMQLWRISILRSLASHLLHNERLIAHVTAVERINLIELIKPVANETKTSQSIYSQLRATLTLFPSRPSISRYLDDPRWDDIEILLGQILSHCPPVCFFIDAVDEEFKHAPMYWQRCQKGLFYQVMKLLKDNVLGGRLHVFIAIRDIVLSSVYLSEHKTRYLTSSHIRILRWCRDSIEFFLHKKLDMLSSHYFINRSTKEKSVSDWLGTNTITNGRKTSENLIDYLIRHTRCIPRDIVIMGNLLCREVTLAKERGQSRVPRARIRAVVGNAAAFFADEELTVCANHLASDEMPSSAGRQGYSGMYTSTEEYVRDNCERLKQVLSLVGKERFGLSDAQAVQALWKQEVGTNVDLLSVLWQHRVIGYVMKAGRTAQAVFHEADSGSHGSEFRFPDFMSEYIFHGTILHAVGCPVLVGTRPIYSVE